MSASAQQVHRILGVLAQRDERHDHVVAVGRRESWIALSASAVWKAVEFELARALVQHRGGESSRGPPCPADRRPSRRETPRRSAIIGSGVILDEPDLAALGADRRCLAPNGGGADSGAKQREASRRRRSRALHFASRREIAPVTASRLTRRIARGFAHRSRVTAWMRSRPLLHIVDRQADGKRLAIGGRQRELAVAAIGDAGDQLGLGAREVVARWRCGRA